MRRSIGLTMLAAATACSGPSEQTDNGVLPKGPHTNTSALAGDVLPTPLRALVERTVPGLTISEAERKEREGRVYFDVEGKRTDGSDIELDIMQEGDAFRVVEIQRDIAWDQAPLAARAAAAAKLDTFAPTRVIESTQTEDGSVVYELFAPGRTDEPAMEVRLKGGKAEVLGTRWSH